MVNPESSVFLFIGEDNYSKEEAIKALRASLLDGSSNEFDYKLFYGQEANAQGILDYLNTVPFLASKRLAVIKDFEKLPKELKIVIASYIKKPSKSTCLVIETKDDSSVRDYDLSERVNIRRFEIPKEEGLMSWMRQFLAARGKTIDEDAAGVLKELHGQSLSILALELEKLVTFIGNRKAVNMRDVEEVTGKSLIVSAFDITSYIMEKRINDAMRMISDLILGGKKHYEIMGILAWHFRRMLKAKMLQAKGENDYAIAGILKIGRRHAAEFFKQTRSLEVSQIKSRIEVLLDADLDIKRTKFDPTLILEFAVIRLCLG